MGGPLLQIADLVSGFGEVRVHDGVSFAVDAGTITGLIGPNGAGKTTLFSVIAGALKPRAGAIWFDGKRSEPRKRVSATAPSRSWDSPGSRPRPASSRASSPADSRNYWSWRAS